MKTVRVATGYSNVPLPDGRLYNPGPLIRLTDQQYNGLSDVIKRQLVILLSSPDPASYVPPTPAQSSTYQLFGDSLAALGVPIFLIWDGTDYQPTDMKANVDRPKTFIGPTDPNAVTGVNLVVKDQWIQAA